MDAAVSTAEIARALDRKPASLSPARDALIKKGLIYCGERGTVAFTVPHFGRYLRTQPAPGVIGGDYSRSISPNRWRFSGYRTGMNKP